ncbi:MAG: ACP S-malonyltransferase [Campylobacterales bacterium]
MKRVGYLFPGQGSQGVGMGKAFVEAFPLAREMLEAASSRMGFDMGKLMFEADVRLEQTAYTQPAILLVSMMALKLFEKEAKITPLFAMGHSLGEVSAVAAVGGLDAIDAVALVHERGRLMQQACEGAEAGMMVLLGLDDAKAEEICAEGRDNGLSLWPANYNADGQIVLAGLKEDLALMEPKFKEAGAKRAMLLAMSVASHCPLLASAVEPFKALLEAKLKETFRAPVISNVTTEPYRTKAEAVELLSGQLVKPVRYKQSIERVAGDVDVLIEFGHGKVLAGLNKKIATPTISVNDPAILEAALKELA